MRTRGPALVASAVVAAGTFYLSRSNPVVVHRHHHEPVAVVASPVASSSTIGTALTLYYCLPDGHTLVPWQVRLGDATDIRSVAYFVAVKAITGPADTVKAIRFPVGTSVRSVHVATDSVTVDLSADVEQTSAGGFAEIGEFKSLVWSLTQIPTIKRVIIRVSGAVVPTLPGGHLELDEPLSRSDF